MTTFVLPGHKRVDPEGGYPGQFSRIHIDGRSLKEPRRTQPIVAAAERRLFAALVAEAIGYPVPLGNPRKSKRCKIEKSARLSVHRRDGFRCRLCGWTPEPGARPDENGHWPGSVRLTVDHIIPASYGGLNLQWNLRTLCSTCNESSGDDLPTLADFPAPPPRLRPA